MKQRKNLIFFHGLVAICGAGMLTAAASAQHSDLPIEIEQPTRSARVLETQILVDWAGHSPGVIDGVMGSNTRRAIRAFANEMGLPPTEEISDDLLKALRASHDAPLMIEYVLTEDDVAGPFVSIPSGMSAQASLETLGYESPAEGLAEKFHMSLTFLKALNPNADFSTAGTSIRVVAAQPSKLSGVTKIEVDKGKSELRAFDAKGDIIATYPATVGSGAFPSPSGAMELRAIAPAPTYYFDPSGRNWGPDRKLTIAAGPNNPVGGTWIDLSKDGYGIHGTPEPSKIGKTSSHGCVRLTNWDAEELAKAVEPGTTVTFL